MSRIACIGARTTPFDILKWMEHAGQLLVEANHIVVSGNAPGADQAWARGASKIRPASVELWLPWIHFESQAVKIGNVALVPQRGAQSTVDAENLAAILHPKWRTLSLVVQLFHIRNVFIIRDSSRVMYWCDQSRAGGGGTGFALSVAKHYGIPTHDVAERQFRDYFEEVAISGPIFP